MSTCEVESPHSHIDQPLYGSTTHPSLTNRLCREMGTTLAKVMTYERGARRGRPVGRMNRPYHERILDSYSGLRGL